MGFSCNDLQTGPLYGNRTLSLTELYAKIKECPLEICALIYGPGSTDLTSIGALISIAIQLALALSYWLTILLFKSGIIPLLQGRRSWGRFPILQSMESETQYAFITWLSHDHGNSLWHQLYFTLALSVACLTRQISRSSGVTGVFESSSIISFLTVSFISLHVTMISYYKKIERGWLFMSGYAITFSCGVIAVLSPISQTRAESFLHACVEYAAETTSPWRPGAIGPISLSDVIQSVLTIALLLVSLFFWLWLRRVETKRFLDTSEVQSLGATDQHPDTRTIMRGTRECSHPDVLTRSEKATLVRKSRILYILILLISGFHIGTAIYSFQDLVRVRQAMNVLLANRTEQNIWE